MRIFFRSNEAIGVLIVQSRPNSNLTYLRSENIHRYKQKLRRKAFKLKPF